MKKVLILCTKNSCRSIIAEALINAKISNIKAFSAGVEANNTVNKTAKRVLEEQGIWREEYHSKTLESMLADNYDLVVTVCNQAQETCPIFPADVKKLHMGFKDPDGNGYEAFKKTYMDMEAALLPKIFNLLYA